MRNNSITILCADVSRNCLSRALTLAEIISRKKPVQIIGFARDNFDIWPPAHSTDIPVIKLEYGIILNWRKAKHKISGIVDHSGLIICKPRLTSLGLALSAGCNPDNCILDINDWELGMALASERIDNSYNIFDFLHNLSSPNSPLLCRYYESKIRLFPHRIVNNQWLQNRFGGELIYDVRDTDRLNPENFDKNGIRRELGLDNRCWIIFAGTPRLHKGVKNIILALEEITGIHELPGLLICGGSSQGNGDLIHFAQSTLGKSRFRYIEQYDRLDAGKYLSAADIACIPSLINSTTIGQVPTKLFEAMSMGLPVIASGICDIPDLIKDIGLSVPPGDITALSNTIKKLVLNPELSMEMGRKARSRALHHFSYNTAAPVIDSLLEKVGS